jgi:hypothetical protein
MASYAVKAPALWVRVPQGSDRVPNSAPSRILDTIAAGAFTQIRGVAGRWSGSGQFAAWRLRGTLAKQMEKRMALAYEATFRTKRGSIRDYQFAETREEAARLLFERNPTARTVQTCNAYFDEIEHRMRGNGTNIQWIERERVPY